jgi:hypothetical protein
MQRVAVTYGVRSGWVYLRSLRGDDEESVDGTDTLSAIALLDRVLVDAPGAAIGAGKASELCAADRDRVLAALYRREIGARVTSSPTCPMCRQVFDLDFDLAALMTSLDDERQALPRDGDGVFQLDDGTRFRLPSGTDELVAVGAAEPALALLARCRLSGPADTDALGEAMQRVAPLVEAELDAVCPGCAHPHVVRFDIQSFLLLSLIAERRQRTGDVHRLARAFGWSLTEILALSRSQRRLHVALVDRAVGEVAR